MRLLILTAAELTRDPRARRQVEAALAAGIEPVGLCGRISGEGPAPLPGVRVLRVGPRGSVDPGREIGTAVRRDRPPLRELRGLYRLVRLAARTGALARAARSLGEVDVVHANDLDTLPAAAIVARRRGARLVYDAHELYSGYEAEPPRLARAALLALERRLAGRADAVVTVSEPLAAELERTLRLREPPLVVLNAPALEPLEVAGSGAGRPRAVYQGAFGPGRPLADLLEAAAHAPGVALTIRAVRADSADVAAEIARRGLADRVEISPPVPPDRLVHALAGADVGIVFDRPESANGALSSPNKLFEYLMAGLAVVATDLPGLAALVREEHVGVLVEPGRPDLLGAALVRLAADPELPAMQQRARAAAVERYNAAAQRPTLLRAWGNATG